MKKSLVIMLSAFALSSCGGETNQKAVKMTHTPVVFSEVITLVKPVDTGATLQTALQNRQSVRSYSPAALSLEQLSGVLWAAAGQNRENGKLTVPSAMALYPLKVYAVFPEGVYLYNSAAHNLTLVKSGNYMAVTGRQPFVEQAALNLMYIADMDVYAPHIGRMGTEDMAVRMCYADAGHYCQNVYLYAAANSLGAITRGSAQEAEFLNAIEAPAQYRFIMAQTVGVPAE